MKYGSAIANFRRFVIGSPIVKVLVSEALFAAIVEGAWHVKISIGERLPQPINGTVTIDGIVVCSYLSVQPGWMIGIDDKQNTTEWDGR